jgi:hypothetical protein
MGLVIPFPSAAHRSRPGADIRGTRGRFASIGVLERLLDFAAVMSAVLLCCRIYGWVSAHPQAGLPTISLINSAALFSLLFVLLLEKHGEYRPYLSLLAVRETERLLRVWIECFLVALPVAYCTAPALPRSLVIAICVLVPVVLVTEKYVVHVALRVMRSRGYGTRKAVILGAGTLAKNVYSVLVRSPKIGLDPVAMVDEEAAFRGLEIHASSYHSGRPALVLAGPLSARLFRNLEADVLVIADPEIDPSEMLYLTSRASELGVSTYVVSRDYLEPGGWLEYSEIDGMMLARLRTEAQSTAYEVLKRALDIVTAGLILLLLAPVFIVVVPLIRLTSAGPAVFKQQRAGYRGRLFWMYKFRSMYMELWSRDVILHCAGF